MPEQLLEGQITIITGGVEDLVDHLQGAEKVSADAKNNVEEMANAASKGAANFTRAEKNLKRAKSQLDKMKAGTNKFNLAHEIAKAENEMRDLQAAGDASAEEVQDITSEMRRVRGAANEASHNTDSMAGSNAQARQSAMALGNIMSDLPHGPAAAANNVGNLIEGFGQMSDEVGSGILPKLKAMAGPALLAGAVTGVATLAANWDSTRAKIVAAKDALVGVVSEQRALNKAVREYKQEFADKLSNTLVEQMGAEEARRKLEQLQKIRKEMRKERRDNMIKNAPGNTITDEPFKLPEERDVNPIGNMFPDEMQNLLDKLNTKLNTRSEAVKEYAKTIDNLRKKVDSFTKADAAQYKRILRISTQDKAPGPTGFTALSAEDKKTVRKRMIENISSIVPEGGFKFATTPPDAPEAPSFVEGGGGFGIDYGGTQVESSLDGGKMPQHNETEDGEIAQQLLDALVERAQARGSLQSARKEKEIRQQTEAGSMERMRRMAKANRDSRLSGVNNRLERLRNERDNMKGSATESEMLKQNAKIDRALAKRISIRQKYLDKKKSLLDKEQKEEAKARRKQINQFNKFSQNIGQIGSAMNQLYSTWRQKRTQELKAAGKSEKQISKQIEQEGRKRFKRMKKIKMAGAILNTISSGVQAYYNYIHSPAGSLDPFSAVTGITQMATALATGYAQVRNIQATTIGGGVPGGSGGGAGGGASASFTRLGKDRRNDRVRNFSQEQERDRLAGEQSKIEKAVREENAKNRDKMDESRAIGDEESFDTKEAADEYEQKALS